MNESQISFDDFKKVEIRIGKILSAERVEDSNKLLKLKVDFGATSLPAVRQVIAGIGKAYEPEAVVGKLCPFAYNLESKSLAGLESQGMILCPSDEDGKPVLMHPDRDILPGSMIK